MQVPQHDVFQAIADPTRRQLLALLAERERPVQALCAPFAISRPAISKHLQVLADAGLVHARREGRETVYAFDASPLLQLKAWLSAYDRLGGQQPEPPRASVEAPCRSARPRRSEMDFAED